MYFSNTQNGKIKYRLPWVRSESIAYLVRTALSNVRGNEAYMIGQTIVDRNIQRRFSLFRMIG